MKHQDEVTYTAEFDWPAGIHPAAELFPMMDTDAFSALVRDIDVNGQHDDIWLDSEGRLLDGRNRLAACQALGINPRTRIYDGAAATDKVISLNVHRRHLTQAQLAAVAVDALPLYEAEAEARMKKGTLASAEARGKSSTQAAQTVGVGHASVERLKKVKRESVETFEQVRNGEKSIREAEREVAPRFKSGAMNKLEKAEENNPPRKPGHSQGLAKDDPDRLNQIREMAGRGMSSRQIHDHLGIGWSYFREIVTEAGIEIPADKVVGKTRRIDSNRVVAETVSTLEGLVMGVGLADVSELDPEQIEEWVDSFTDSIKALTKFRNQMKEHTQ